MYSLPVVLAGIRYRFRLNAKRSSQLSSLALRGQAKVRGQVSPGKQLLTAPITGRSCVFYTVEIGEWFNGTKTPLLDEHSTTMFRISDYSGTALIDPESVDLYFRRGLVEGHSSDYRAQHKALLARHAIGMVDEYGELRSLAFRERVIEAGDTLCALGTVRYEADPSGTASYREQPSQLILGSEPGSTLLLSDAG